MNLVTKRGTIDHATKQFKVRNSDIHTTTQNTALNTLSCDRNTVSSKSSPQSAI
jgi:hypothetical protein